MNHRDKMKAHSALLCVYAGFIALPSEGHSDLFGWAIFYSIVAVSVVGLWRAVAAEIRHQVAEARR